VGQQQILLIVLALIIVGVAIAISVQLFRANAIEAKRDILVEETTYLGTMAIQYFKKPTELGGGNQDFTGWQIPSQMIQTANGNFMIAAVTADEVTITGTGSEVVTGTDSIKVQTIVTANGIQTIVIH
jgi:hypothetical protein